jgi:hypothetical protein
LVVEVPHNRQQTAAVPLVVILFFQPSHLMAVVRADTATAVLAVRVAVKEITALLALGRRTRVTTVAVPMRLVMGVVAEVQAKQVAALVHRTVRVATVFRRRLLVLL